MTQFFLFLDVFSHLILAERHCDVEKEHPQGIAGAKQHKEVK